jgi:hypothetical protein
MSADVRLERTDGLHGGGTVAYRVLVADPMGRLGR